MGFARVLWSSGATLMRISCLMTSCLLLTVTLKVLPSLVLMSTEDTSDGNVAKSKSMFLSKYYNRSDQPRDVMKRTELDEKPCDIAGFPDIVDHGIQEMSAILHKFYSRVTFRNRNLINPHNFRYMHNVPSACVGKKVELLIGVTSNLVNIGARRAIRETWGKYAATQDNNAVLLFFLGARNITDVQAKVDMEALEFGDIIQEDFTDTYRNLTLKSVALLKWASTYCADSNFVLKVDDDMYINIPHLIARLRHQLELGPLFLLGYIYADSKPVRTKAKKSYAKWLLTRDEYPWDVFPNYLPGTCYAMSTTAAMRLYVESCYMHPIFLEDVFLTGLVADRAAVPRISVPAMIFKRRKPKACEMKQSISEHKFSPDEIRKLHKDVNDLDLKCPT